MKARLACLRPGTRRRRGGAGRALIWTLVIIIGLFFFTGQFTRMSEGQVRSRVSRVKSDFRTLAAAIHAHHGGHGTWPGAVPISAAPNFGSIQANLRKAGGLELSIFDPAAGMPVPPDPFLSGSSYAYATDGKGWILTSSGPDEHYDFNPATQYSGDMDARDPFLVSFTYDPTNGSYSRGDIIRTSLDPLPAPRP